MDVDTFDGLRQGIPCLLDLFTKYAVRASFFVPFGPDESGKAAWRLLRHRGFLEKMRRTKALSTYGFRTLLSGTLLPSRRIGPSFPHLLKDLIKEGHELGLHGYNHVFWHDHLFRLSRQRVRQEFLKGYEAFRAAMGHPPSASAAPGWQCNEYSLEIQDELEFTYHSDTRGTKPYFPLFKRASFRTLEIPTTLPTWDELWNASNSNGDIPSHLESLMKPETLNVMTIHAEIEGNSQRKSFEDLLKRWMANQVEFVLLKDAAKDILRRSDIPRLAVQSMSLPGRAGVVSCAER